MLTFFIKNTNALLLPVYWGVPFCETFLDQKANVFFYEFVVFEKEAWKNLGKLVVVLTISAVRQFCEDLLHFNEF